MPPLGQYRPGKAAILAELIAAPLSAEPAQVPFRAPPAFTPA
jgi:hypothetical protein